MTIMQLHFSACHGLYDIHHYRKTLQHNPYNSILKKKLFENKAVKVFGSLKFSKFTITHRF